MTKLLRIVLGFSFLFGFSQIHAAKAPQIINIGNGAEPKDLDPQIVTGVPEHHIILQILEPLVSADPKTLEPVPAIAESWTVSKDLKTYTFKLRKNAKWSNGDPVVSKDFVYSWTRLLKPETAAEYAYQGYYIKNGKKFNSREITDASKLGLNAPDDYTLVVELEAPTPFFLGLLNHHSLFPVHQKTVEKFGSRWTRPENFVGNGAFVPVKWQMNKVITLKPNAQYWDKEKITITEANYFATENVATEEKMFRAGELHVTNDVPLEKLPYWQKDTSGVYQQHPYLGTYYYWVNVKNGPLTNKKLRQALAYSFDRESIVKNVTRGGQLPGTMFTPPGTGGYTPPSVLPANLSNPDSLKKAKQLLAEALTELKLKDVSQLPPVEILYNTHEGHKKIAEALQQMWKKNLGINVKLFNQEWKVYLDTMRTGGYQLARAGWIADYNDPNSFLDMLMTGNGNNRAGYSNPKYDALINKAALEKNAKKRLDYFKQAEEILLDEMPVVPIYIYTRLYLKQKSVQGWYPNIQDIHPLKYVSIQPNT